MYEAKTAQISNFWTFRPIIQLLNQLETIVQKVFSSHRVLRTHDTFTMKTTARETFAHFLWGLSCLVSKWQHRNCMKVLFAAVFRTNVSCVLNRIINQEKLLIFLHTPHVSLKLGLFCSVLTNDPTQKHNLSSCSSFPFNCHYKIVPDP